MAVIGIITESKLELEIKRNLQIELKKLNVKNTLILINKNSIKNFFNIKFDFLILDKRMGLKTVDLTKLVLNSNVIILNADYDSNFEPIRNLKLKVITYGTNSKATLTLSSVEGNESLITLQRSIRNIKDELAEPQEIKIKIEDARKNLYLRMIVAVFIIFFDKN